MWCSALKPCLSLFERSRLEERPTCKLAPKALPWTLSKTSTRQAQQAWQRRCYSEILKTIKELLKPKYTALPLHSSADLQTKAAWCGANFSSAMHNNVIIMTKHMTSEKELWCHLKMCATEKCFQTKPAKKITPKHIAIPWCPKLPKIKTPGYSATL